MPDQKAYIIYAISLTSVDPCTDVGTMIVSELEFHTYITLLEKLGRRSQSSYVCGSYEFMSPFYVALIRHIIEKSSCLNVGYADDECRPESLQCKEPT